VTTYGGKMIFRFLTKVPPPDYCLLAGESLTGGFSSFFLF